MDPNSPPNTQGFLPKPVHILSFVQRHQQLSELHHKHWLNSQPRIKSCHGAELECICAPSSLDFTNTNFTANLWKSIDNDPLKDEQTFIYHALPENSPYTFNQCCIPLESILHYRSNSMDSGDSGSEDVCVEIITTRYLRNIVVNYVNGEILNKMNKDNEISVIHLEEDGFEKDDTKVFSSSSVKSFVTINNIDTMKPSQVHLTTDTTVAIADGKGTKTSPYLAVHVNKEVNTRQREKEDKSIVRDAPVQGLKWLHLGLAALRNRYILSCPSGADTRRDEVERPTAAPAMKYGSMTTKIHPRTADVREDKTKLKEQNILRVARVDLMNRKSLEKFFKALCYRFGPLKYVENPASNMEEVLLKHDSSLNENTVQKLKIQIYILPKENTLNDQFATMNDIHHHFGGSSLGSTDSRVTTICFRINLDVQNQNNQLEPLQDTVHVTKSVEGRIISELRDKVTHLQKDYKNKEEEIKLLWLERKNVMDSTKKAHKAAAIKHQIVKEHLNSFQVTTSKLLKTKEKMFGHMRQLVVVDQRSLQCQRELDKLHDLAQEQSNEIFTCRTKYIVIQKLVAEHNHQIKLMEYENLQIFKQTELEVYRVNVQYHSKMKQLAPLIRFVSYNQKRLSEMVRSQELAEGKYYSLGKELQSVRDEAEHYVRQLADRENRRKLRLEKHENLKRQVEEWKKKCTELEYENVDLASSIARLQELIPREQRQLGAKLNEVSKLSHSLKVIRVQLAHAEKKRTAELQPFQERVSKLEQLLNQSNESETVAVKNWNFIRVQMSTNINKLAESVDLAQTKVRSLCEQLKFVDVK